MFIQLLPLQVIMKNNANIQQLSRTLYVVNAPMLEICQRMGEIILHVKTTTDINMNCNNMNHNLRVPCCTNTLCRKNKSLLTSLYALILEHEFADII